MRHGLAQSRPQHGGNDSDKLDERVVRVNGKGDVGVEDSTLRAKE